MTHAAKTGGMKEDQNSFRPEFTLFPGVDLRLWLALIALLLFVGAVAAAAFAAT